MQIYEKNKDVNYEFENIMCFYFINPFMFSNSGHDLSTILDYINYIIKNNIKNILIIKGYTETNNYKLIKNILPKDINIIELLPETIYFFKKMIIIHQNIFNIYQHKYLINNLKDTIINKYSEKYIDYKNKNIILMKTNRNKNVMLKYTQINCEKLLSELEKLNYLYIIPEDTDIFYLALLLMNASKIVFSTGSVLYTNKIFFNENADLYYITHKNNINTCMDGVNTEKLKYIFYENNDFDDDKTNDVLNQII